MHVGFVIAVTELQKEIHEIAVSKGFWDCERNDGEMIALMHEELSEALSGLRSGNPTSEKLGHPFSQVEEEMADVIIRVLDYCGGKGHHVAEAVIAKMAYNAGRQHMHGRKF